MKEIATAATASPLDKIIADAKAKREQEAKAHRDTMTLLNALKKGSIFAK